MTLQILPIPVPTVNDRAAGSSVTSRSAMIMHTFVANVVMGSRTAVPNPNSSGGMPKIGLGQNMANIVAIIRCLRSLCRPFGRFERHRNYRGFIVYVGNMLGAPQLQLCYGYDGVHIWGAPQPQ